MIRGVAQARGSGMEEESRDEEQEESRGTREECATIFRIERFEEEFAGSVRKKDLGTGRCGREPRCG